MLHNIVMKDVGYDKIKTWNWKLSLYLLNEVNTASAFGTYWIYCRSQCRCDGIDVTSTGSNQRIATGIEELQSQNHREKNYIK